jgi:hypothetical protein
MAAVDCVPISINRGAFQTLDEKLVLDPSVSVLVCQLAPNLFDHIKESRTKTCSTETEQPNPIFKIIKDPVEVFFAKLLEARDKNDQTMIQKTLEQLRDATAKVTSCEERAQRIATLQLISEMVNIPKKKYTLSPHVLLFQYFVARKLQDKIWIEEFFKAIEGFTIVTQPQLDGVQKGTYHLDAARMRDIKEGLSKLQALKLPYEDPPKYLLENGETVSEEKYLEMLEEGDAEECSQEMQTLSISSRESEVPIDISAMKYIQETLAVDIPTSVIVYKYFPEIFDYFGEMNSERSVKMNAMHPFFAYLPCAPETFIAHMLQARAENIVEEKNALLRMLQNAFCLASTDINFHLMGQEIFDAFNIPYKHAASLPVHLFQFNIALLVGDVKMAKVLFDYIKLCFEDPQIQRAPLQPALEILDKKRTYSKEELDALLDEFRNQPSRGPCSSTQAAADLDQMALEIIQSVHSLKNRSANSALLAKLQALVSADPVLAEAIVNIDPAVISLLFGK